MVEVLTERIKAATQALEERSKSLAICKQLRTIPGVGLLTSLHFAASIDDIKRFKNAHAVSAYLGLTPGEHSSGAQKKITGITKAGHVDTRSHLVQAAWTSRKIRPSSGANASPNDAGKKSLSWPSRASWRGSSTRCGAITAATTPRAAPRPSR